MSDTQLLTAREDASVAAERLLVLGEKSSTPGPGVMAPGQLQKESAEETVPQQPDAETRSLDSQPAPGIMRALREVRTLVGRGLCRLGIHRGPWVYPHEGNCTQSRACARCGATHTRTKHQREWHYIRERTCEQVRSCGRCDAANGERTRHDWGETYDLERRWWQNEKRAHRCLRCGVVEEWTVSDAD